MSPRNRPIPHRWSPPVNEDYWHRRRAIEPRRKADWNRLRALALSLRLPNVEETTSWGQPTLKAHGKLWVWWSPHEDAPVFKVAFEEREILVEAEPNTFFFTPHYKNSPLVLVRPEKLDLNWARANLLRVWRAQAPKRVLQAYDAAEKHKPQATGRASDARRVKQKSPRKRQRR